MRPAKLWCDTATAVEAQELAERLGRPVPTGFTASKLAWIKQHEPHNWARIRRVLLPHDYVNFWLTGEATMECGDASGSGWFDPSARDFDAAAMAAESSVALTMLITRFSASAYGEDGTQKYASEFGQMKVGEKGRMGRKWGAEATCAVQGGGSCIWIVSWRTSLLTFFRYNGRKVEARPVPS